MALCHSIGKKKLNLIVTDDTKKEINEYLNHFMIQLMDKS